MLVQLRGCDVPGNTDIKFGDGNVKSGSSESGQLGLETANLTEDQMSLRADPVNRNAAGPESADEREECVDLGSGTVEVVVVDVELRARVGSARGIKSDVDKVLTEHSVEDRLPEAAIFLEDLVDNVLGIVRTVFIGDEDRGNIPRRKSFPYNEIPGC